jgi:pimeloyl-ACP methyl ester carboxylesterase
VSVPTINLVPLASGAGLPLVVGPSLGTRVAAVWGPTVPLLSDRPVYGWDLPGHGVSPAATSSFSISELVAGIAAAVEGVGLSKFAVAGVSLGGLASLALGLSLGSRVTSVTQICSLPALGTREGWADRAAQIRASGTPSVVQGSAARWFAPGFIEAQPTLTSGLLRDLMDVDDESYALCAELLGASDLRSSVSSLTVPYTLIEGELDAVVSLASAEEAVASARDGRLEVLPGVAHLATVEDPASVARILAEVS